ncbi:MAG: GNAT family N-acetyltransferase/peptidase C39 family protein [Gammaproteobacteria bacterium]|nr:GNAT family N-acetyltransferase/peptidase C39 family protein [Gammaproteobacteria bacterium]
MSRVTKPEVLLRAATRADIGELVNIEATCFQTDKLSRRSFLNLVRPGPHDLIVVADGQRILGYVLNLYRHGTNLARMYSIAVLPEAQGRGLAGKLMEAAEAAAIARHCVFIRLEVNVGNKPALALYEKRHYRRIGRIRGYYEDGADANRMEKHLNLPGAGSKAAKPYYEQTTDFTCGPASLMMAMKTLDPKYRFSRTEELQIWREATTIFMTSGHGGCSPHGLALSAWQRGFSVSLYINYAEAPFIDGVRDDEKKAVIELVHEDFLARIDKTRIRLNVQEMDGAQLDAIIGNGDPVIALISTWRLNRNKAPHWVYVTGIDDEFIYINDPDQETDPHLTEMDYIHVPVTRPMFQGMARFGRKRLRCLLVLHGLRKKRN